VSDARYLARDRRSIAARLKGDATMIRLLSSHALLCCSLLVLAACSRPQPPEKERPPEPTAAHTGLRDAISEPIDKARQAEVEVQEAADEQRAEIEAAGG
jgi:hypothetical protein